MPADSPNTGPYPKGDARNVTLTPSDNPIEPPRTGPVEDAYRDDEERAASANAAEGAKGADKKTGVDGKGKDDPTAAERSASDKPPVGETSLDPSVRARADANRPLGS